MDIWFCGFGVESHPGDNCAYSSQTWDTLTTCHHGYCWVTLTYQICDAVRLMWFKMVKTNLQAMENWNTRGNYFLALKKPLSVQIYVQRQKNIYATCRLDGLSGWSNVIPTTHIFQKYIHVHPLPQLWEAIEKICSKRRRIW